jgi:transcriptional regulator with XRE-family HTH domain|tara:strand:+ start:3343 stop:3744 length:402 start_codon:yes stop_codon:yes gene_type:complete
MKRTDYGYADLTSKEIYNFRKDLGMSQVKLARKIGLSLRTWCHYEYGTQRMPVSVHMALQFLQNGGEEAEKVYDNVRKHQDPLTKYDMDRITRLRKSIKDTLSSIKDSLDPLPAKIITQSDKEMGFLLSKINN